MLQCTAVPNISFELCKLQAPVASARSRGVKQCLGISLQATIYRAFTCYSSFWESPFFIFKEKEQEPLKSYAGS